MIDWIVYCTRFQSSRGGGWGGGEGINKYKVNDPTLWVRGGNQMLRGKLVSRGPKPITFTFPFSLSEVKKDDTRLVYMVHI